MDVLAANVGCEVLGPYCSRGCATSTRLLKADTKLGEGAAKSIAPDGSDGGISLAPRREALLNVLLTRGCHAFEPLGGFLSGAAMAAKIGVALFRSRQFGLVGGVLRTIRFCYGITRPFVRFDRFVERRQGRDGFVDVLTRTILNLLPRFA